MARKSKHGKQRPVEEVEPQEELEEIDLDDEVEEPEPEDDALPSEEPEAEDDVEPVSDDDEPEEEDDGEPVSEDEDEDEEEPEPAFSDDLLARARGLGFSAEYVEENFATPEQLDRTLIALDRRAADAMPAWGAPQQQPVQQQAPPPAPQPQPTLPPQSESIVDDFKIELDETLYDEPVVKTIKGMQEHWASKYKALEQKFEQQRQAEAQRQQAENGRRFETWMDSREELSEILGKGATMQMNPDSETFKNRVKLAAAVDSLARVYAARFQASGGREQPPSEEELFRRAAISEFGDVTEKTAVKKLSRSVKRRSRQIMHRPTQRKSQAPKPGSKAADYAAVEEAERIIEAATRASG